MYDVIRWTGTIYDKFGSSGTESVAICVTVLLNNE